jgi:folate-binding protein YgfZ
MFEAVAATGLIADEYRIATQACALLDRSERGKLALSGAGAAEFLQGQVSNDVEALTEGTGCYAVLLTPKGKMLADLRVLRAADELLLDTERAALQGLFNTVRRAMIGYQAELHKRTVERGLLSLVGPQATALAGVPELETAHEHAHVVVNIGGVLARAIRTDLGVDLLCDSAVTEELRQALLEAGAVAVDEATIECLRVEHGRPRYGLELDETVIPQEAGLNERAVSFTKGCYVGQETVARLHYRGKPNRYLRGLKLSAGEPTGSPLRHGDREVGRLGSVANSPRLGPIALALVRREVSVGEFVSVGEDGTQAEVVELPFAAAT